MHLVFDSNQFSFHPFQIKSEITGLTGLCLSSSEGCLLKIKLLSLLLAACPNLYHYTPGIGSTDSLLRHKPSLALKHTVSIYQRHAMRLILMHMQDIPFQMHAFHLTLVLL